MFMVLLFHHIQVIPTVPPSVEKYESKRENLNKLKIKVLQLRNRLGRQKRIRGLNERSLEAGKKRADKVEGLLVEMQTDLSSLKGRLQDELNELGTLAYYSSPFIELEPCLNSCNSPVCLTPRYW
jgi:hypothetical protein